MRTPHFVLHSIRFKVNNSPLRCEGLFIVIIENRPVKLNQPTPLLKSYDFGVPAIIDTNTPGISKNRSAQMYVLCYFFLPQMRSLKIVS